jgi:hypothetical protein
MPSEDPPLGAECPPPAPRFSRSEQGLGFGQLFVEPVSLLRQGGDLRPVVGGRRTLGELPLEIAAALP